MDTPTMTSCPTCGAPWLRYDVFHRIDQVQVGEEDVQVGEVVGDDSVEPLMEKRPIMEAQRVEAFDVLFDCGTVRRVRHEREDELVESAGCLKMALAAARGERA